MKERNDHQPASAGGVGDTIHDVLHDQGEGEPSEMPIRLQAELRLQQGFQQDIHKQSRRYAAHHQQAIRITTVWRLGEVYGIFAVQ